MADQSKDLRSHAWIRPRGLLPMPVRRDAPRVLDLRRPYARCDCGWQYTTETWAALPYIGEQAQLFGAGRVEVHRCSNCGREARRVMPVERPDSPRLPLAVLGGLMFLAAVVGAVVAVWP